MRTCTRAGTSTERGAALGRDGDTPVQSALARAGNLWRDPDGRLHDDSERRRPEDLDLRDAVNRWQTPGSAHPDVDHADQQPQPVARLAARPRPCAESPGCRRHQTVRLVRLAAGGPQTLSDDSSPRSAARQRRSDCDPWCTRSARGAFARRRSPAARDRSRHVRDGRRAQTDGRTRDTLRSAGVSRVPELHRPSGRVRRARASRRRAFDASTTRSRRRRRCSSARSRRPGLSVIFGTDAVALAHGRNADELVCRVRAGQRPMDALTSATSAHRAGARLGRQLGVVAPGYVADLIAVHGDPAANIAAVRASRSSCAAASCSRTRRQAPGARHTTVGRRD